MRAIILALVVLSAAFAVPAGAAPIPDAAWKDFIENSVSQYGAADRFNLEDQLYVAAKAHPDQAEAIADFAGTLGIDVALAQDYAALIVEAGAGDCGGDGCPFKPGYKPYDDLVRLAPTDPSGSLMATIAHNFHDQKRTLLDLADSQPATAAILLQVGGDYGDKDLISAGLLKLPSDPDVLGQPILAPEGLLPDDYPNEPDLRNGYLAAVVEATDARLSALPLDKPGVLAWRAALTDYLIGQALWLGLDDEAIARYRGAPAALRGQLVQDANLSNRFVAALWEHGDRAEALAMLKAAHTDGGPDMLADALAPSIADADLFDLYIQGPPKKAGDGNNYRSSREGWLSAASYETPALRRVMAARLSHAGYADMAAWLSKPVDRYIVDYKGENLPAIRDRMPADVLAAQPMWARKVTDAEAHEAVVEADTGTIHVTAPALAPWWTEKPLPAGVRPWSEDEAPAAVPRDKSMPVPADGVLRYEGNGKDAAIVFESSQYDLPGEVPAYGLWLARKVAGTWQKPLYLGLQAYFPYVASAGSRLPMIDGDRLHLEVQVREIDRKTITFPPVGLGYARQADGLYLDMSLADLARDSDGDGLTDIEEARLGLKADKADSDGDGLADGRDALPLTAFDVRADPATAEIGRTILEQVVGHDAGAIVLKPHGKADSDDLASLLSAMGGAAAPDAPRNTIFLVSDVDVFSGILDAPYRLIVYSSGDLKRLGRGDVPFYPPEVQRIFRSLDGSRTFVEWSASWVGGSFMITCKAGACSTETMDGWIT